MKIYFGSDHAGFELKEKLKKFVESLGYQVEDLGNFILDEKDDYPDFIFPVAEAVAKNLEESRGIILGGSGQGEAMVANRIKGIRAAVFYGDGSDKSNKSDKTDKAFEIIKLSRQHNDANILSLGARFLSDEEAEQAVKIWLETEFSGEERHVRRIAKLDQ